MTPFIQAWFRLVRQEIQFPPGRVLEIGSYNVNGSVRDFFQDASEYIGIDMQDGPGVDVVLNASKALETFGRESFDTILCCEMLEHDIDFLGTVKGIHAMLKDFGVLVITTPTFGFPSHRFPKDYWRFGEDVYREVFFDGFRVLALHHLDDFSGPKHTLAAIGQLFREPRIKSELAEESLASP